MTHAVRLRIAPRAVPVGPLDQRHRSGLAGRRNARGLSGRRRRADRRPRAIRPVLGRAERRGAAALARLPARLSRTRSNVAARRDRGSGDGRRGRGDGRAADGHAPSQVAERHRRRPTAGGRAQAGRGAGRERGRGHAGGPGRDRHRRQRRLAARDVPAGSGGLDDEPARSLARTADRLRRTARPPSCFAWSRALLALRDGHFDVAGWHDRQVTTGRTVRIEMPDGTALEGTSGRRGRGHRGRCSSRTPPRPAASASCSSAKWPREAGSGGERRHERRHRRPGCNELSRPVFGKAEASARLARLDRDRGLVEAARRDPTHFDALYRKYLAQVYSYAFYELRDHHAAEDATERVFMQALAGLPRFEERVDAFIASRSEAREVGADAADFSTFRVWLFRIARNVVANERRRDRRRPVTPLEEAGGTPRPGRRGDTAAAREAGSAAWQAVARLPRGPPPRGHPAFRRRDVHGRDRRRPGPLRGSGPGAAASSPALRGGRPAGAPELMLGGGTRDARRTERYLDELMAADERRATGRPRRCGHRSGSALAAGELRAGPCPGPPLVPFRGSPRRPARGRSDAASGRPPRGSRHRRGRDAGDSGRFPEHLARHRPDRSRSRFRRRRGSGASRNWPLASHAP